MLSRAATIRSSAATAVMGLRVRGALGRELGNGSGRAMKGDVFACAASWAIELG